MKLKRMTYMNLVDFSRLARSEQIKHLLYFVTIVAGLRQDMTAKEIATGLSTRLPPDKFTEFEQDIADFMRDNDQIFEEIPQNDPAHHQLKRTWDPTDPANFDRKTGETAYALRDYVVKELHREIDIKWSRYAGSSIRRQLVLAILLIVAGMIYIILRYEIVRLFPFTDEYVVIVGLAISGCGAAILMFLYLRGAISFRLLNLLVKDESDYTLRSAPPERDKITFALEQRLTEVARNVDQLKSAQLDALAGNKSELIAALQPIVITDVAKELEARFAADAIDAKSLNEIRGHFESSYTRLNHELSSLSRRSNLNLVIGVFTTLIAVILLIYLLTVGPGPGPFSTTHEWSDLIAHYVPRLTLVLLIEVFSFFFLRLYRSTLAEIRSYQEDITKLTVQQVALETVWLVSDQSARTALAKELVISNTTPHADSIKSKEVSIDPELLTDLLQKFAKVLVKGG